MPHFCVYNMLKRREDMEVKDRLKKIRSSLHLTQQEFADRLGIKRNTVATYETGKSNPSDSAVVLICREFDVREEWLRTGEGEMFKPKPSDVLDQLAYKYQFSNADYAIAEKFVSLNPNKRKELIENVFGFLHEIEAALSDTDPYAPAYGAEPPRPMDDLMDFIKKQQDERATMEDTYIKSRSNSVRKTESSASNTISGTDTQNQPGEEKASSQ